MGQCILITGSREATPAMGSQAQEVVRWMARHDHVCICGDASGIDAVVRASCHRENVLCFVVGGYGKIRGLDYPGEQPSTITGGYLGRDRVMAQRCDRGVAIMRAPRTHGTWYTGTSVESLGKRMRWAVWDTVTETWSYYDRSEDILIPCIQSSRTD